MVLTVQKAAQQNRDLSKRKCFPLKNVFSASFLLSCFVEMARECVTVNRYMLYVFGFFLHVFCERCNHREEYGNRENNMTLATC